MKYIITSNTITVFIDGQQLSISKSHPHFSNVKKALKKEDFDNVKSYMDIKLNIDKNTKIAIVGSTLFYDGKELHNTLATRIVEMFYAKIDISTISNFLENLMLNPSKTAIKEFYSFLEYGKLPITTDGYFLAYKNVSHDYTDIYSGKYDNSVGATVSMDRNEVDDDRNRTCSAGLHFCSKSYLESYASVNGHTMLIKINPKDVVSIPSDYNDTKGRCCEYEVIEEYHPIQDTTIFSKPIIDVGTDMKLSKSKEKIYAALDALYIKQGYPDGIKDIELDLAYLRRTDRSLYELSINAVMHSQDILIKRGTAVDYFKFFKDNF